MPNVQSTSVNRNQGAANKDSLVTSSATMSATPGTEVTVTIPAGTKAFTIRAKGNNGINPKLTFATSSGGTATDNSFDIMPGSRWKEEFLKGTNAITLYMISTKPSTKVQILLWS